MKSPKEAKDVIDNQSTKPGIIAVPTAVTRQVYHIVPRFKSGSSNRNNLVPACRRCNQNKASQYMEEWYRQQDYFCEERLERLVAWAETPLICPSEIYYQPGYIPAAG